jgi:hypothetical protein
MQNINFEIFERFHQGIGMFLHDVILVLSVPQALLKKEKGCSSPSTFFCNKTTSTVLKEAKEKIRKFWGIIGTDKHRCLMLSDKSVGADTNRSP